MWPTRALTALTVIVGVLGWVARAWPLLTGHAWENHVDLYDDGVYLTAAANLVRGTLPYRDFTLVHPPGIVFALAPIAWLPPASSYVAARWVFAFLSAGTISLCALGTRRALGHGPSLVAVTVYAFQPDIAAYERGAFLEPLLNLGVMALFALATLEPTRRQAVALGATVGMMCCVKLLAMVWAVPVVVLLWPRMKHVGLAVAAAAFVGLLVAAPFALTTPHFADMVLRFHLWRPPDGEVDVIQRMAIISLRLWAPLSFVAVGVLAGLTSRKRPPLFALASWASVVVLVAALLFAKTFWIEYLSHVAAPLALSAGGAAWCALEARPQNRLLRALILAVGVGAGLARIHWVLTRSTHRDGATHLLGAALQARLTPADCVVAVEPTWALAANTLPTGPVDSYGAQLVAAMQSGAPSLGSIGQAFAAPASQDLFAGWLQQCRFLVWSGRGDAQATAETVALKDRLFRQVWPEGPAPIILLERR